MTNRRDFLLSAAGAMVLPSQLQAQSALPIPSGLQGWVLMRNDGMIVDALNPDRSFIPASTIKLATSFAALSLMRPDSRFSTRLTIDGPVKNGVVQGNLHLIGGGDPTLNTADLDEAASVLAANGIRGVTGSFFYYDGALPRVGVLNETQPWQATYNPAISGLNLNFNRSLLRWEHEGGHLQTTLTSEADGAKAQARSVKALLAHSGDRFSHRHDASGDSWIIPVSILNAKGSRHLPVRYPGLYSAEVLRELAEQYGVMLPMPRSGKGIPPRIEPVHTHQSDVLYALITQMMKYSTNLTAEIIGMGAAMRVGGRPQTANEAARITAQWLNGKGQAFSTAPKTGFYMDNHSGLSADARMTPLHLAELVATGINRLGGAFEQTIPKLDLDISDEAFRPFTLRAKTGTMHFVRSLAGTLDINGVDHSFAIMAMDPGRRAAIDAAFTKFDDSRPDGSKDWLRKATSMEKALLRRWVAG